MKKTLETIATVVILAAVIVGAMWLGESLSVKSVRQARQLIECVDKTEGSDSDCDSCHFVVYGQ